MNPFELLEIYYTDEYGDIYNSKVYYVDSNRDRFLVVKYNGYFIWVNTKDCRLKED